jgi:hypothetical protein
VFEADGQDLQPVCRMSVSAYQIDQGQNEGVASQDPGDGECVVRYQVHA